MYVIEVIPLTLLPSNVPQLLTYFFDRQLNKGSVVEVSIGNRKVNAVVFSVVPLEQRKILLKTADFQLKKISKIIDDKVLVSEAQLKIAVWLSQYYYAPLGYCLKTVLPPFFLKKKYELDTTDIKAKEEPSESSADPLLILTRAKETIKNIQPFIQKTLKNKGQVLIVVPEVNLIEFYYEELAKYNEVSIVHSKVSVQKLFKSWQDILSGNSSIIVGTRQSLFACFKDLKLVVVDDPSSEAYKSDMTPRYNTPDLAAKVSEIYGCQIIYTTPIPTINEYSNIENGAFKLLNKVSQVPPSVKVVNMVEEIKSGNFSLLSRDLKNGINSALENKEKILIFSPRKGYSGVLGCENCGFLAKCPNCSVPMRLHKVPEEILICHRCYRVEKIPVPCPNCNSSKLRSLGTAGTQKVAEEIERYLKLGNLSVPVYFFDADIADDIKKEKEILEKMKESGPAVVVATHKIFSQRYYQNFSLVGVLNTDVLTSTPDFRSDERLFYQIEKLFDFEPKSVVIQAYNTESSVMSGVLAGDYKNFYSQELVGREMFYYPPFSRIVRLSFKHKDREKAVYAARLLSEKLKMVIVNMKAEDKIKIIGPSSALVEREKGFYIYNLVLKLPIDMRSEEILKYVSPYWSVDLDPRSVV